MPYIELRKNFGVPSPSDILLTVQDRTFEYLLNTEAPEIRISAYFDRDYEHVDAMYEEVFVRTDCPFRSKIMSLTPGSKARRGIVLPGRMASGEQLVITVKRSSHDAGGENFQT